jgi:hypothetical protein
MGMPSIGARTGSRRAAAQNTLIFIAETHGLESADD